jgi:teichuronic acid biosynthesis glycosyltransferase TuaG
MDSNVGDLNEVTVIIPCFNSQDTVERAFDSIKNQTIPVKKIIFVDDASTDNTLTLLKSIQSNNTNIDITILENSTNLGPGLSRNLAWDKASTIWISFLDSDDAWVETKNEIQINFLTDHKDVDFLSGESYFQDIGPVELPTVKSKIHQYLEIKSMLFRNKVSTRTVILRREIPHRFSLGLSEDFKLWLTLLNDGYKGAYLKIPLARIYKKEFSKGGISSKRTLHEYYELKAIFSLWKKYSKITLTVAAIFSALKYFRRQLIVIFRDVLFKSRKYVLFFQIN